MNDEIKVGDKFLVEVEVTSTYSGRATCRPATAARCDENDMALATLLAAKRLPRALKVGDRVRDIDVAGVVVILALHGERAWVTSADDSDDGWITHLSDLTLAEEAR